MTMKRVSALKKYTKYVVVPFVDAEAAAAFINHNIRFYNRDSIQDARILDVNEVIKARRYMLSIPGITKEFLPKSEARCLDMLITSHRSQRDLIKGYAECYQKACNRLRWLPWCLKKYILGRS